MTIKELLRNINNWIENTICSIFTGIGNIDILEVLKISGWVCFYLIIIIVGIVVFSLISIIVCDIIKFLMGYEQEKPEQKKPAEETCFGKKEWEGLWKGCLGIVGSLAGAFILYYYIIPMSCK